MTDGIKVSGGEARWDLGPTYQDSGIAQVSTMHLDNLSLGDPESQRLRFHPHGGG